MGIILYHSLLSLAEHRLALTAKAISTQYLEGRQTGASSPAPDTHGVASCRTRNSVPSQMF
jgi:hypothetical protein